ncbi:carboxylesterase/lipase family protein [Leifsonia poae]|uniref:carboxylesterase/lipase family protein n=1 Tax=Leifsonia poae TaxID=110933 RepID=UPI001CBBA2C0|nr:carboxylesterase/lipase family protein [Leifsonia poae]
MSGTLRRERPLRVAVTGGEVLGVREGAVCAWRGIPYAAPPFGELRFRAPAPVVPWSGVLDASRFGSIAPQTLRRRMRGVPAVVAADEDCLTVNVQAPAVGEHALPVMVFIHGGGYSAGSSREFSGQGQSFVLTGRTVYVSFNYRLGPLGYLDFRRYGTGERPVDGNPGLRDQVALLRWVHENIGRFGGDPANVTVFGESAGGNAVTTLLATPAAGGLFARAIAQSAPPGAVYGPELTAAWAEEFVGILRKSPLLGDDVASGGDDLRLLTHAPVDALLAASLVLQARTPDEYPGMFCLAPVVDGDLLPEHPLVAFRDGRAHRIPLIIGTNEREGSIFHGRVDILPRTASRIAALFSRAPVGSHKRMRQAYPGLPSARRSADDFGGDYGFWFPSIRLADFHSAFAPVHVYRFDFAPRLLKLVGLDATHGVEMFALFDRMDVPLARAITSLGGREAYAAAGERMREHWLAFAEDGRVAADWPTYDEHARSTLIIAGQDRLENDPRRARRRAWMLFLPQVQRPVGRAAAVPRPATLPH